MILDTEGEEINNQKGECDTSWLAVEKSYHHTLTLFVCGLHKRPNFFGLFAFGSSLASGCAVCTYGYINICWCACTMYLWLHRCVVLVRIQFVLVVVQIFCVCTHAVCFYGYTNIYH